jgi:hypothetical protein
MTELQSLVEKESEHQYSHELAPNLSFCFRLRLAKQGLFGCTPEQHKENLQINRKCWSEWIQRHKRSKITRKD